MNQKVIINIVLLVLVVILAGTVGYLTLIKKPTSPATTNQTQSTNTPLTQQTPPITSPKPVNWESLLPTIRTVIGSTFLGMRVEESGSLIIFQKSDVTGDGIPEALVNLGTGGAYTSSLTLMRVENDKPVVVQFKQKEGKISSLMFLAGASAGNGESVVMLPDKNAIYAGHWSRAVNGTPFGSLTNCSVEAYQWNSQTKTFDFSLTLSNEVRPGFCREEDKKIGTLNWKTYRNEQYGFELKYPSELKLSENPGSTWTYIVLEKPSFRLTFFAGMREVGGYIGYGTVWTKKISIDGKMVDETLIKCEGNDVILQIAYTKIDGETRFDRFDSNCFDKSLIDTFIPQMEAVTRTLKYSK